MEARNWGLVGFVTMIMFALYRIFNDIDIMDPPFHTLEIVLLVIGLSVILAGIYFNN